MPPPRLKRSNTAGQAPASLEDGEIAINQADGLLYYHTSVGGVSPFGSIPTLHKSTHATGGSDALSAADIGALTQATADSRYVGVTGDTMSGGLIINSATPLTVTGGRTILAAASEPYGVGVKYVSSGGAVYFGATDGTSTPGAQISKAGGVALMSFTNAGAASIPGTLTVGGSAVVVTTDSRLSDARTPTSHTHAATEIVSGTLSDARLSANVVLTTDSRLSDARTPTSHAHGNITNAGSIGTTASLPIITTTSGVLTTGAFGTTTGTFCQGNDGRLSDSRTPLTHTHAATEIVSGTLSDSRLSSNVVLTTDSRLSDPRTPSAHSHGNITAAGAIGSVSGLPILTTASGVLTTGSFGTAAGTFCQGNDSRLSDSRAPASHKSTHATGGSDALSAADIGALTQTTADSRYVNLTGDTMSGGLTISAATPLSVSGGRSYFAANGEPWGVGVKHGSSGGSVYFGATDGTATPGAQISNSIGVALMSFTNAGAASIPGTLSVGSSAVVVTTDSRLTDARTPVSHTHGNISNAGAIGSTSGLPIITTTSGVLTAGAFGTTAGSFCQGNDARLSDSRSPLSHTQTASTITDFAAEAAKYGPVTSVNGLTGAVTISAGSSISDGSKGDITVSGSGATWTINANAVTTADIAGSAVTYAKIQNVSATDRLLGRSTAGAGVVEEITCTAFGRSVIAGANAAAVRTTLNAVSKGGDAISGSFTVTDNVGIGTLSPGAKLDVYADGGYGISCLNNGSTDSTNYALMGTAYGSAAFNTGLYINCLNASYNYGVRILNPSSASNSWAIYSDATAQSYFNGNVGIGTVRPAVKLDVAGAVRASTGILFGTDTASSNRLSDYEEGTWTPAFTSGFSSVSVSSASGRYIKVGKSVTANLRISVSAFTGNSYIVQVSLPFAASSTSLGGGFVDLTGPFLATATAPPIVSGPSSGGTSAALYSSVGSSFTASDFATGGWTLGITVLYTAD